MDVQRVLAAIGIAFLAGAGAVYFFNGETKLGILSISYGILNILVFLVK
jgi:hypothetical protein